MNKAIIKISEKNLTLRVAEPCRVGTVMNWDIQMPVAAHLDKLTVRGTVTECAYSPANGSGDYLLSVAIGDLSTVDQAILKAYVDFLERESALNQIAAEHQALQETLKQFSQTLSQFISTAEWMIHHQPGKGVTLH